MINNQDKKVIFHIDIDSFFVSAELTLRQELKNQDIAISVGLDESIVSSLSYSAKRKGAKVPMKLKEVKKYCPKIIVLKPNFELYNDLSNKIYEFLKINYSPIIEIGSIDEWYVDMTNVWNKFGNLINLASDIQTKIKSNFGLDASIGISYNKFLAKMSTDLNKPKGITITRKEDLEKNIWPLSIEKYCGVGKKMKIDLMRENILTIGDLAKIDLNCIRFRKIFKNKLNEYVNCANGIDNSHIDSSHSHLDSINNSCSFYDGSTNDTNLINNLLKQVSQLVATRLQQRSLHGNKITVYLKIHKKFISISKTLLTTISDWEEIYENAFILFNQLWDGQKISGVGIKINSLINKFSFNSEENLFLCEKNKENKFNIIQSLVEKVNTKCNKKILYTAKEFSENKSLSLFQSKYIK